MKKRRTLPLPSKTNDISCPCGSGRKLLQCCKEKNIARQMADAVNAHQANRLDMAFSAYEAILATQPDHADALHYQGVIHLQRGDFATAVSMIQRAIAVRPAVPAFYANLGNALKRLGRLGEAQTAYAKSLQLDSRQAAVHFNLALLLGQTGANEEALAALKSALRLRPDWAEAWFELGKLLYAMEAIDDAAEACRTALKLNPSLAPAQQHLGRLLLRFGDVDAALSCFESAQQLDPANPSFSASHLFALGLSTRHSGQEILAEHTRWQQRFADGIAPLTLTARAPGERLRIAYLSGDLRQHAMRFFVRPLLRQHDRRRVAVTVYATHAPGQSDVHTAEFQSLADAWCDVHALDDAALAQRIAADGIDVLIDLAGHSAGGRMHALAAHPARRQYTMLGYMTTTGARGIDARIADGVAIPASAEAWFSEDILRLPYCQWCYAPDTITPPVNASPAARNGFVTYGAFHNVAKINARVLDLWVRLLSRQPQARLVMVGWGKAAQDWLRAPFARAGLAERVVILNPLPYDRYLELYHQVDVALDVFPYAGGTVSCEALWMGVPVLTLAHDSPAGRGGASIMTTLGMPEWIAQDEEAWLTQADECADRVTLADMRVGLRARLQASPLMDAPAYAAAVENLLVTES